MCIRDRPYFITKSQLQTAVAEWFNDNAQAIATYGEISTWDVSLIDDFSTIFSTGVNSGASTFNDDISLWDVSNATDFSSMFYGCSSFNQSLNSWE